MTPTFTPQQCYSANLIIPQGADFEFAITYTEKDLLGVETVIDPVNFTAEFAIRKGDTTGDVVFSATHLNYISLFWIPNKWAASTAYSTGQLVVPTVYNGYVYEAANSGTSAGSEPSWPLLIGGSEDDNGILWNCVAYAIDELANITIELPASITGAMTDWGKGVYTLKVFDDFGRSVLFLDGKCHLRTEAT